MDSHNQTHLGAATLFDLESIHDLLCMNLQLPFAGPKSFCEPDNTLENVVPWKCPLRAPEPQTAELAPWMAG